MRYTNITKLYFYTFILLCFGIFVYSIRPQNYQTQEPMQLIRSQNKICCLYSYFEKDEKYKNNFIYFLSNGILDNVDYYIIINGSSTVEIPDKKNICVYTRENRGYDFGAYSYALKQIEAEYDYYFFINTSVIGPYYKLKSENKDWTTYFIELFNTDDVKLVGTSINVYQHKHYANDLTQLYGDKDVYSHIQSMFFCMKKEYLDYLQSVDFFNEEELNDKDMVYVIEQKEFGLSQLALNQGWNINCILDGYRDLDYIKIISNNNASSPVGGDPYYENGYFGKTITENDVMFFKNARF